jgi:hypothetical protein
MRPTPSSAPASRRTRRASSRTASADLLENTLVGALGAPEFIEPLILLSGDLDPVVALYERATEEYLRRCASIGLGDRRGRSPLPGFLELLRG